jgi:hypothetical protein
LNVASVLDTLTECGTTPLLNHILSRVHLDTVEPEIDVVCRNGHWVAGAHDRSVLAHRYEYQSRHGSDYLEAGTALDEVLEGEH